MPPPSRPSYIKEQGHLLAGTPNSTNGSISRQKSVTSNGRLQKQRSLKREEDDDKIKRSRAWPNAYELSQDLHEKQLEMLEKKYGGFKARRAAKIIQQAFRQYSMNKNFQKLRTIQAEKRLSRKYGEFTRSHTIWSDMVVSHEGAYYSDGQPKHFSVGCTSKRLMKDKLYLQKSSESLVSVKENHTKSLGQLVPLSIVPSKKEHKDRHDRHPLQRGMGLDFTPTSSVQVSSKASKPPLLVTPEESNNNRNSYPELNDSSASDSPQDTPLEPHVDLPSVNFENLLESKETDILNDSFQSDGSTDGNGHHQNSYASNSRGQGGTGGSLDDLLHYEPSVQDDILKTSCDSEYDQWGDSVAPVPPSYSDIQVSVEDTGSSDNADTFAQSSDSDRTPTQEQRALITKVYGKTEVRLRKKKQACLDAQQQQQTEGISHAEPQIISNEQKSTSVTKKQVSPIWKRKSAVPGTIIADDAKRMSNISETSEQDSLGGGSPGSDTASMGSEGGGSGYRRTLPVRSTTQSQPPIQYSKVSDPHRRRMYRVGLNLFNK